MFWAADASTAKWLLRIFLHEDTARRLTTTLFINKINVLFTLEGELLIVMRYFQPQIEGESLILEERSEETTMRRLLCVLVCFAATFALSSLCFGQATSSIIVGTVVDVAWPKQSDDRANVA